MKKTPKRKACKSCGKDFDQYQSTHVACSPGCAHEIAKERLAKKSKQVTAKMRREFNAKDRSYQLKKAQEAFNAFIRERDKNFACISCGTKDPGLRYDAGHYRTIGAHPELRYDEDNCHKQCHYNCNIMRSGNIVDYRINLSQRIGLRRLERLEGDHEPKNYTLDEIIAIKLKYRAKLKDLKQRAAA